VQAGRRITHSTELGACATPDDESARHERQRVQVHDGSVTVGLFECSWYLPNVPELGAIARRLLQVDVHVPHDDDGEGVRAAVAVVLREGDAGVEVLLIKRAEREGDPWSGHMAFPGGRHQSADKSLLDTAVRETLEEVGLNLATHGRAIARLPDVMPYSRMPHAITVTAFVFNLERPAALTLNEEVAEAIWTPLDPILANEPKTRFRFQRDGVDLDLPSLEIDGRVVWGLTYRMLELLREALA
jgi:8-oxo-dGTP pyrophosphatase MutT (NUDIX family)